MKNTKNTIAISLMKKLINKSLEDITVADIVNGCNVSRQTFYYYFNDIYSIVGWIYVQEVNKMLNNHLDINTWQESTYKLLNWIKKIMF